MPGVVVADTHCIRITGLLGLTDGSKDPGKVEQQLRRESTGRTETPAGSWAAWWETARLEQRRQAAALLLREVRLYPDHGEAVLH